MKKKSYLLIFKFRKYHFIRKSIILLFIKIILIFFTFYCKNNQNSLLCVIKIQKKLNFIALTYLWIIVRESMDKTSPATTVQATTTV